MGGEQGRTEFTASLPPVPSRMYGAAGRDPSGDAPKYRATPTREGILITTEGVRRCAYRRLRGQASETLGLRGPWSARRRGVPRGETVKGREVFSVSGPVP